MRDVLRSILCLPALLAFGGCSEDQSVTPLPPPCCDEGPLCYDDTFSSLGYGERDRGARWSPDGTTVAYCHSSLTEAGIYLMTAIGTENRQLLNGVSSSLTWSPDGLWLVFSQDGRLYRVGVDGGTVLEVPAYQEDCQWPDWSPDGSKISYSCGYGNQRGIWVISFESPTGGAQALGSRRLIYPGLHPRWSHSGRQIVFKGYLAEGTGICVMDSSGADARLLFGREHWSTGHPAFSPDDGQVVFQCAEPGHVPQIWTMKADGSDAQKLTTCGGAYPEWSPEGNKIIYTDTRRCNGWLWIMKADGTCKKQLTHAEWWPQSEP